MPKLTPFLAKFARSAAEPNRQQATPSPTSPVTPPPPPQPTFITKVSGETTDDN